jgi:hypothetical protein
MASDPRQATMTRQKKATVKAKILTMLFIILPLGKINLLVLILDIYVLSMI